MTTKKKVIVNTILSLIPIFLILIFLYPQSEIIQGDTLWHIKNGEWIITNRQIPYIDYFSYHDNLNFMAHEWLFDIIIFYVSKGGTLAIHAFAVLTTLFGYCFAVFSSKNHKQWVINSIIMLFLTIAGFYKGIMAIPDTLAASILIILGNNIVTEERPLKNKLIINVVLGIFLVNYHGGMMSAALIQSLFLTGLPIVKSWFCNKKLDKQDIICFISLTGTLFICSLINPYFIQIYKYGFMINSKASEFITDWQPFAFSSTTAVFAVFTLLAMAIIGMIMKKKKISFDIRYAAIFFYIIILFRYRRAVNLFTFALIVFAGEEIFNTIQCLISNKKIKKLLTIIICLILSFLTIGGLRQIQFKNQTVREYITDQYIDATTLEYIKDKKILNLNDYGGHLIYCDIPVFVDGRIDVYSPEYGNPDIFTDYLKAMHSAEIMSTMSDKYGFDILALDKNSLSAQIFIASPEWEVINNTNKIIILERKNINE